jgi:hypothetical protein
MTCINETIYIALFTHHTFTVSKPVECGWVRDLVSVSASHLLQMYRFTNSFCPSGFSTCGGPRAEMEHATSRPILLLLQRLLAMQ